MPLPWPYPYVDNAAEFKSEALRRGCEQHGINLEYRPAGQPHFGGIVERVIGTAMGTVHELPGTTFSNPVQRGDYDSEGKAALTLRELERWLALAVAAYHGSVHGGLGQTPAGRWAQGVALSGAPPPLVGEASGDVSRLEQDLRAGCPLAKLLQARHGFTTATTDPQRARRS